MRLKYLAKNGKVWALARLPLFENFEKHFSFIQYSPAENAVPRAIGNLLKFDPGIFADLITGWRQSIMKE